ncbi:MAG: hypothetical protein GXP37_15405 [Chloroflexi bacterium]|nr:hypothetical protein [Chloroflexota bacterium]
MNAPPPIILSQITADTLPALQSLYEASERYFVRYGGGPARPEMAAFTYSDVLDQEDRALLGVWWQHETMVGCFDLRFHHPTSGIVWFGALILADEPPLPRDELASWCVRILEEWLRIGTDMQEIRLALPSAGRDDIRFWQQQGYLALPKAVRHLVGGKQQRFVIYHKAIPRPDSQHQRLHHA